MAQTDRGSGGAGIPIAPLVAMLLFAGGLLVQHQPLQSDRPVTDARAVTVPHYGQDVEARLWQDPLEAVQAADRTEAGEKPAPGAAKTVAPCGHAKATCHTADWLRSQIAAAHGSTLVLPVMIFGGPYAEDAEDRRRTRYAVLSNLMDSKFQPVYSRGIGYVAFDDATAQAHGLPKLVPFERWEAVSDTGRAPHYDNVFVIWLTEESFVPKADEHLRSLFDRLLPSRGVAVKVVGPASQETADDLWPAPQSGAAGPRCGKGSAAVWGSGCVEFLAPRLTTPGDAPSALRFSPDDRRIAIALVDELSDRNIALPSTDEAPDCAARTSAAGADREIDDIAIVVEADTHYGRSLEQAFLTAVGCPDSEGTRHLHIFRYFRGLDGKTSHKDEAANKAAASGGQGQANEATAPQERAQGQSQFDYLLRIASRVREQNDRLAASMRRKSSALDLSPSGRSIRAVVILGSDVYDKLAILHALRERLPQAIFATSDMDAAFLQGDQSQWTRNLVVATGYDLRLHRERNGNGTGEDPQMGTAPFRDTYQTATFLAARTALFPDAVDPLLTKMRVSAVQKPLLYEIGDGSAVWLKPAGADGNTASAGGMSGRIAAGLVMVVLFGLLFSWGLRGVVREQGGWLVLGALLTAAYVGCVVAVSAEPGEEPLRWFAGVSIWPSEFIRLVVVLVGVALLLHARRQIRAGEDRVESEFELRDIDAGAAAARHSGKAKFWRRLCPRVTQAAQASGGQVHDGDADRITAGNSVRVVVLWQEYRSWNSPSVAILRVAIGFALCAGVSVLLLAFDPPVAPVRGTNSLWIDYFTNAAAAAATLLLLVATVARVSLATLFLRRLYGSDGHPQCSTWNEQGGVIQRFCGVDCRATRSYIDLMLSAQITASVGDTVLYPFVLSVLLLVARSPLFDNWVTPWGLFIVIGAGLGLVIVTALALRHSAERIRRYTVEQLTKTEVRLRGGNGYEAEKPLHPDKVKLMREVAEGLRTGAFAPLTEQPIVRALMLPFGGAGAMGILQYLLMARG
jgi:hypothetical protein